MNLSRFLRINHLKKKHDLFFLNIYLYLKKKYFIKKKIILNHKKNYSLFEKIYFVNIFILSVEKIVYK